MDGFIQIGVTAARDPLTGDYLPAVPLYIEQTDLAQKSLESLVDDFSDLEQLVAKFGRYKAETEAAGVAVP